MIILGLDISTSNVGYALLESGDCQRHRVIKADSIRVSKKQGLYDKARYVRDILEKECSGYMIDAISVEESLISFGKRKSSAATLALLNRFNGIISYVVREMFQVPIAFVNSTVARNRVGLKILKNSKIDTKEQIFAWTKKHELMKDFKWPTKIISRGKRKGEQVYEVWCYDISDAFVTALWACNCLNTSDLKSTIC